VLNRITSSIPQKHEIISCMSTTRAMAEIAEIMSVTLTLLRELCSGQLVTNPCGAVK